MGIFSMWKNVRLVALVAVTAALYAAVLVPFKVLTLIPGFTEIRPGNAIPIACSLLFGPPAAWGSAIGNLVGDVLGGTFTMGSIFGFFGNFFYGLLPFYLWRLSTREPTTLTNAAQFGAFISSTVAASFVCAAIIAPGVQLTGGPPMAMLGPIIFANNAVIGLVLGGILLVALYPAVRGLGLTYDQIIAHAQAPHEDLE